MKLMSNSMVFCEHFVTLNVRSSKNGAYSIFKSNSLVTLLRKKRRCLLLVPSSKKSEIDSDRRTWWQKFFFDDERDSLNIHEDELLQYHKDSDNGYVGDELSEQQKFEVWKRRAEALSELQEAREDARNAENNEWQDWLDNGSPGARKSSDVKDWDDDLDGGDRQGASSSDIEPDKSLVAVVKDLVLRNEDELLYEDKVFRYASSNSAKFLAVLVLVPWAMDFLVHDYVLLPFLDRYVKTVPLAAEMLDVRRSQKFEMIKALNVEKAKFRFEVEIGKSPPLSDEEMWWELRDKALELRDEKRLENRKGFANIWSDMVFGITLFLLIYFNKSKVALLKFTGYKIINNVSDAGKAFLIILITDIFLGYHSESGWQTLIEVILEHYGLEIDQAVITLFICFVPVIIDACVKLWLFKFLPKFSPNVSNIFREMQRH